MRPPCSSRWAAPTGSSWWRTPGALADSEQRSPPASPSTRSTTSTRRPSGSPRSRYPSPTPVTWRRPPCRAPPRWPPRPAGRCSDMAGVAGVAEFRMPALGADMESGTIVEWLVAPGDTVHRGDVVAVVDTDKSAIDVECFDSGVVERLLVGPGQRVPVGTPLAVIAASTSATGPPVSVPAPPLPVPPAHQSALPTGSPPAHVLSPLIRRQAAEAG